MWFSDARGILSTGALIALSAASTQWRLQWHSVPEIPTSTRSAATPWTKTDANTSSYDGALILDVYYDNDTSAGHSTGGAWTAAEQSSFGDALNAWASVANIHFLGVNNVDAADLIERKVTEAEIPGDVGKTNFRMIQPTSVSSTVPFLNGHRLPCSRAAIRWRRSYTSLGTPSGWLILMTIVKARAFFQAWKS